MTNYAEKRERKRVDYVIGTEFIFTDGTELKGILRDISMGGAFLITENHHEGNTRGKLKIHLNCGNQDKEIQADCLILRTVNGQEDPTKNGIAVQIVDIDPDSSITLYNVVKYQTSVTGI